MWTGDAYRPFLHDLHFSAAWSFQIAVVRARDRTSANRIQGWQRCLSAPKCAAAIGGAVPVAKSGHNS
jgi:hypothetical protein